MSQHPRLSPDPRTPHGSVHFSRGHIYADTEEMAVMRAKYDALKASRFFQGLQERALILATWDDHDYGANDAGAEYPMKRESQREFLDWLGVPEDSAH